MLSYQPVDAEAEHTFKLLDLDGNGYLDTDELEEALKEIAAAGKYAGTGAAMAWGKAAADGAKLFEEIDSNKDGQLSRDEWVEYFNFHVRQVGREKTVQLLWQLDEAAKLLKGRGAQGATGASFTTPAKAPSGIQRQPSSNMLVQAEALHTFKLLDIDRNDSLDPTELGRVLKEMEKDGTAGGGYKKAAADGAKLFAQIDTNQDGELSREEWCTFFHQYALDRGKDTAVQLLWQLDEAANFLIKQQAAAR